MKRLIYFFTPIALLLGGCSHREPASVSKSPVPQPVARDVVTNTVRSATAIGGGDTVDTQMHNSDVLKNLSRPRQVPDAKTRVWSATNFGGRQGGNVTKTNEAEQNYQNALAQMVSAGISRDPEALAAASAAVAQALATLEAPEDTSDNSSFQNITYMESPDPDVARHFENVVRSVGAVRVATENSRGSLDTYDRVTRTEAMDEAGLKTVENVVSNTAAAARLQAALDEANAKLAKSASENKELWDLLNDATTPDVADTGTPLDIVPEAVPGQAQWSPGKDFAVLHVPADWGHRPERVYLDKDGNLTQLTLLEGVSPNYWYRVPMPVPNRFIIRLYSDGSDESRADLGFPNPFNANTDYYQWSRPSTDSGAAWTGKPAP